MAGHGWSQAKTQLRNRPTCWTWTMFHAWGPRPEGGAQHCFECHMVLGDAPLRHRVRRSKCKVRAPLVEDLSKHNAMTPAEVSAELKASNYPTRWVD